MSIRDLTPPRVDVAIDWPAPGPLEVIAEASAQHLLAHGLETEGRTGSWEFAIRFVGDIEMSQMHERFMNDPAPTDIMTFPYDEDDDEYGGDIVISVETAARNAAENGWSTKQELEFLMLHGLLHILGWDDESDDSRAAMLERQHEIIATWDRPGSDR